MKIIEHTSSTLIIRDCPGRILFAGLCILAIAGFTFFGLAESYTSNENKINEYTTILVLLFSVIGFAIGGCIVFDQSVTYISFDKLLNAVTVRRARCMKTETRTCRLNDIEDIVIAEKKGTEDFLFYSIALKLKENDQIPISAAAWVNDGTQQKNVEVIKKFLSAV